MACEAAATNHALDPSGENVTITTGWTRNSGTGTLTRDDVEYASGTHSVKYVAANGGGFEGLAGFTVNTLGWTGAADVITCTVEVKGTGVLDLCFFRANYDDASATDSTSQEITLTSSWVRYTFSLTLNPAKTVTGCRILLIRGAAPAEFTIFADKLFIGQNTGVTPYFDGSFGHGYAWTGTANASSSTRAAYIDCYGGGNGRGRYYFQQLRPKAST